MGTGEERRVSPRYPFRLRVSFRREGSRDSLRMGEILNISEGGLCLAAEKPEPVGALLEILYSVEGTSSTTPVCRGKVAWAQWLEENGGEILTSMGVRVVEMGAGLERFLKGLNRREG